VFSFRQFLEQEYDSTHFPSTPTSVPTPAGGALWKNLPPTVVLERTKQLGHLRCVCDLRNIWWGDGDKWFHPNMDMKLGIPSSAYIEAHGSFINGRGEISYSPEENRFYYRRQFMKEHPLILAVYSEADWYNHAAG
jgi:hypothetical protein